MSGSKKELKWKNFLFHEKLDLAIIRLDLDEKDKSILKEKASTASIKTSYKASDELFGFCFYGHQLIHNYGRILEDYILDEENIIESDLGGVPGFSGCGYYDLSGELSFLHEGPGNRRSTNDSPLKKWNLTRYSLEFSNSKEVFDYNDLAINFALSLSDIIEANNNKTLFDKSGFKTIGDFIDIIHNVSRNPRTLIVPAKELLNLKNFNETYSFCKD